MRGADADPPQREIPLLNRLQTTGEDNLLSEHVASLKSFIIK